MKGVDTGVVLDNRDLVGLHANELPHLKDLVVRTWEEEPPVGDEALLPRLLGEDQHRSVVINVHGLLHMCAAGIFGRRWKDDLLPYLDAHDPGGDVQ